MTNYDAIVVGLGGVGSAAAAHLAAREVRVLGLEQFQPAHDRGSSHGHTRIIRQAYCEHPDYVPLVHQAYRLWSDLQASSGETLYREIGLLQIGDADGMVVGGVLQSAKTHDLPIERIPINELPMRFPGFTPPENTDVVFEKCAGILFVERCVLAHQRMAQKNGADLKFEESVEKWSPQPDSVRVETNKGSYSAGKLVLTAGAWAGRLLRDLGVDFEIRRKHVFWFENTDPRYTLDLNCPAYLFETPEGLYYGIPQVDDRGMKAALHSGGESIVDPTAISREIDTNERDGVQRFLARYVPGVGSKLTDHTVCMYTMSPDEHFIVDRYPHYPQVAFAAGLSGHGFKFTGVLGKALTEMLFEGGTNLPVHFLNCRRPALHKKQR